MGGGSKHMMVGNRQVALDEFFGKYFLIHIPKITERVTLPMLHI